MILFVKAWCYSDLVDSDEAITTSSEIMMRTFAKFTPTTFERIHICVFHLSIAFFGCSLCLPILIYAKNNASAARFKLVNNFIVYICIVSFLFGFLQIGFGIR